jgi:hypothetical protein
LSTSEFQAARHLGDAGCGILSENCRKNTSEFNRLDPWWRLEPTPQPVNIAAKVVRTSPFSRYSLKQLNERKLELISQPTEMIKRGPDSPGNPGLECARGSACKSCQVLLGRAFTLVQALLQIRTESRAKVGTMQRR